MKNIKQVFLVCEKYVSKKEEIREKGSVVIIRIYQRKIFFFTKMWDGGDH